MDNEKWRRPTDSPILDPYRKIAFNPPSRILNGDSLQKTDQKCCYCAADSNVANQLDAIWRNCAAFGQRIAMLEKRICEANPKISLVDDEKNQGVKWKEELAEKTTIHGLKEVLTEQHKYMRPAWLFIFFMAVGSTTYYVWNVIGEYNLDPTATKVKIMRLDSYEYPVMLFCPDTWLDAGKALSFNISIPGLQYALGFLINFGVNRPPYKIEDYDKAKSDFEDWWYAEGNPFSNLDEFFKHIAVDAERFKRDCSYCDHPQLDQNSLFAKVTMNEGVCYNISMPSIDGRVALGDLDYLHIEMPFLSTNYLTRKSYWKFIVHPDPSLGMSDTHYLQVFPHHSNTIRVMLHHFKSLPNDYCITLEAALSKNYSQSSCVADCFVSSKSQCHPLPMIRKDAMPKNVSNLCNTAQQVAMNKVEETLSHYEEELNVTSGEEPAIQDIPDQCVRECPSVCEKWVYESSVEAHKSTAEEGMTSFHFLNQVIHYGGIISHEEVQTYSFETLISNVGGQMGLWLGASLMSLIELIMFLLNASVKNKKK